ncbi:MAG TPA: PKD domain-containing protein [Verrucomicrobiae bacterium]|nr:PKD domain-containing protein [Verrucomicrobiae bacterium]
MRLLLGLLTAFPLLSTTIAPAASNQLLGWNNLGIHCMDSDYSVFSILPPYNTIEAQLIVNGLLVTNGTGYTVTYQAVADPAGSFNSTAMNKGNFYDFALPLFGANLPVDAGLLSWGMPGTNNTPQQMLFEQNNEPVPGVFTPVNWFRAEGIPLSPYDNAVKKNPYPLMLLVARNAGNSIIATNQIVLPISDEMDCRACHASGSVTAAQPAAGWVWDGIQERDFRLNILRLHDEHEFVNHPALYQASLATNKFNPQGLYQNVIADGKPVLCAACHEDVALLAGGFPGIPSFTASMHSYHASVMDPISNVTLDNAANRSACYRCHPGSTTQCLRGAMGGAVATNGIMEMQCQSCHGNMTAVGSPARTGWLIEPTCENCHSGTATHNNGQIRYTSAFDSNGQWRTAVDSTFATQSNTPAAGLSMYRFSAGHGGLQCEACHGSTHAEFPSTHLNDNLRNIQLQGHAGVMIECTACHVTMPNTSTNGPHGMHPVGQTWVGQHGDRIGSLPGGVTVCQACHGLDYRGTVLSRAQADRTLTAHFDTNSVTILLFRKAIVGCYNCHNGPGNDNINNSVAPAVSNIATNTTNDKSVRMLLPATGSGLTFQIVSQPDNGAVGLSNNVATYFPDPGFVGTNQFTFAAYNGKNSNLATGTVVVAQGPFSIKATGLVPSFYPAGWTVPFAAVATLSNSIAPVAYDWDFDDGTPHDTNQFPAHIYQTPGLYLWTVVASASGNNAADIGFIQIDDPMTVSAIQSANRFNISWPITDADAVLEKTSELGPNAQWTVVTNIPVATANQFNLSVPIVPGTNIEFFRIRRIW